MSGFTPGPWSLSKSPSSAMSLTVGLNAGHRRLGRIYTGSDEYIANARLIAASPDLLDALRGLANALEIEPGPRGVMNLIPGALLRARAAIAKATEEVAR